MSWDVIDNMNEWARCARPRFPEDWQSPELEAGSNVTQLRTPRLQEIEDCSREINPASGIPVEEDWEPEIARHRVDPMARCQVARIDGDVAECIVFVDDFELPRVSFPARVLRQKGLAEGGRFIWIIRDPSRIRAADIDPDVRQGSAMTPDEEAELDRLHAEFQQGLAEDGGNWPEYADPGT
jgi:hypothetical protein